MSRWQSIQAFLLQKKVILFVYIALALVTTIQLLALSAHEKKIAAPPTNGHDIVNNAVTAQAYIGHTYTHYNNYIIFKRSYFHLVDGKDLYTIYPDEQWDLYKYSPTFALLMAPLAYMPDWLGLALWTLLNVLVLFAAVYKLPYSQRTNSILLWFVVIEMLTSLQNSQSNALLAGLMIAAFACMESRKMLWAALWLVLATYIKVYGAVGFCLFLLYPDKIKAAAYTLGWTILFAVLPLMVLSYPALVAQYQSWGRMLAADQSTSYGLSVMGWLHSWFGLDGIKGIVTLAGILLFFLPFVRWRMYSNQIYRLLLLSFILIWVIIFNHKAESPTFIIAVAGAGIWYFARPATPMRKVLLLLVFIGTSLTVTDIFPPYLKQHFLVPYTIKAVPCILLWCIMLVELLTIRENEVLQK
jgi:hypothetical protein